ncbi:MAG: hypothetical protein SVW57_13230 [Thermodesulfobacteriota bacterium]|nr:hypothetical protein [Thermodesulfobacteriota bacterium]
MIRKFIIKTQGINTIYTIDTEKRFVQSGAFVTPEELEKSIQYCLLEGYEITKNPPKKERSSVNGMYR